MNTYKKKLKRVRFALDRDDFLNENKGYCKKIKLSEKKIVDNIVNDISQLLINIKSIDKTK
tara:strand:- start:871 stop:1053 length:183 start_codon:yes stop_codon:yes gene_type:complete